MLILVDGLAMESSSVHAREEWEKTQPSQTPWFKRRANPCVNSRTQGSSGSSMGRRPITCFNCGKSGHMSRECRSRPVAEAVAAPVAATSRYDPSCPHQGCQQSRSDLL